MASKEQQFFNALRDIFVGATVEGQSGYINLMQIKSRYYEQGVFPQLKRDIDEALKSFPAFREELFDKLYTFFHRYFSESGSIYFSFTPTHQNVYDQVYTDDRDVILFWKTHMLYYVKTDRIFRSIAVNVDDVDFWFDVSSLEHKRANEKREVVFSFKERRKDGVLSFTAGYSEKGKKTKSEDILREVRKHGVQLTEDTLERAFRVFERQSEVDFFINKNAREFLREQFRLWSYQYLFSGESQWTEARIRQLQVLRDIAFKIVDFIAQFEDELVRIWNKPKFVLNSHYIITVDKITDPELLQRILKNEGMKAQEQEWRDLGMIGSNFESEVILKKDLVGDPLTPNYRFLPLDTRHFPDLELDILALFVDIDSALDGWLVHSENYQALHTLLPKFRQRVKCIHIDPPYNTDTSGFLYNNNYRHSSWLTMMENRVSEGYSLLTTDGSFLCHIDENEYERLQLLLEQMTVPDAGTIVWDKRNPMNAGQGVATQHEYVIWRSRQQTPIYLQNDTVQAMLTTAAEIVSKHGGVTEAARKEYSSWVDNNPALSGGERAYRFLDESGRIYQSVSLRAPEPRTDPKFHKPLVHPMTGKACPVPPNGFSRTPETLHDMDARGEILYGVDETIQPRQKVLLTAESRRQISSIVQDAKKGKADLDPLGLDFPYCHPVSLYKLLVGAASKSPADIILDFFSGSGTTAHAVIDLSRNNTRRKFILVEMAEYFQSVILPRVKKVIFSDRWKDGKALAGKGISHFVKYYDLEQYEDVLKISHYEDSDLFEPADQDPYNQYVFMRDRKMLDALAIDLEHNRVKVDFSKLYPGVDLAETLSNLRGKWIKRITKGYVEFSDGEKIMFDNIDFRVIKPLIWW